jgi:O-methyltransferase
VRAWLRERRARAGVSPTGQRVRAHHLTYLSWRSLRQLEAAVARASRVEGDFLECGVALGGSAVVIASAMPPNRHLHLYDVFVMIPPPTSPKDDEKSRQRYAVISSGRSRGIGGETYYGYLPDLRERVAATLDHFGLADRVFLHAGLFEDALMPSAPVAFAHLDCDWYDPVRLCLNRIYPVLTPGGYLVCDDYHNFGGARTAVDEFLASARDVEVATDVMGNRPPDAATSLVLARR